jgi:hypothetical protein
MKLEKLVPIMSNTQIEYFMKNWIINGIWIRWQNLEGIIIDIIRATYRFDEDKSWGLLWDIRQLCFYHDIMYTFKLGFYYSNWWLACKVFKLIDWDIFRRRILVFIWIIIILNKYGKKNYM